MGGGEVTKKTFFFSFYNIKSYKYKLKKIIFKGIILCVEKEIIINREKNIYFREKNNLFSDKYFH
jgi:hypothetical protein